MEERDTAGVCFLVTIFPQPPRLLTDLLTDRGVRQEDFINIFISLVLFVLGNVFHNSSTERQSVNSTHTSFFQQNIEKKINY